MAGTIQPTSAALVENQTQQFTASVSSTWSATCGKITSSGLYTAPLYPTTSCKVTATPVAAGTAVSAAITVTSPITMSPVAAETPQGSTQQFTASVPVTWVVGCGSITSSGLFTASAALNAHCTVEGIATGAVKCTVYGYDTIGAPVTSAFTVKPASVTVSEGGTQQFTASAAATWASTCGTITATGLYTAPLYATTTCSVTAKATSGGSTANAGITVTTPITITPAKGETAQGGTQQFTASMPVTWVAGCGTITSTGLFTASATVGKDCTIEAIATGGVKYTAYTYDAILAPTAATVTVTPATATTAEGQTQQFSANLPVTWSASCGTITSTGLYTASAAPGSVCTITATDVSDTALTGGASDTITNALAFSVSPSTVTLAENGTQQFTATVASTWKASCGTISSTGLFTAPLAQQTCNITAVATDGTNDSAGATATSVQLNYTTFRGDNTQRGVNDQEFVLTPSNVNSSTFGLEWSAALDGGIWSQPLYMNAIQVNGATHNVVFATTNNDSVFALDGDTGSTLWQTSLLPQGAVPIAGSLVGSSMNPIGIVGTPVIDPVAGVIYVVAATAEQNNTVFVHRLHALNIYTGAELDASPVVIAANGFRDAKQMQRPGLTLANGNVYVAFAGIDDQAPYEGFIFAYAVNTLALQYVLADEPDSTTEGGGGIWMSATSPTVDENGNLFVVSGNGVTDGVNNYGQSALKISPSLQVLDYFTPYQHDSESLADIDLGSGGALLVPDQPTGSFPHELIVCGKAPSIFVINRDSMGGIGSTSDNVIQEVTGQIGATGNFRDSGHPCFSTPGMFQDTVYFIANHDVMKTFTLNPSTGLLSTTPVQQGTFTYAWPGAFPVISSNGTSNAIVWAYDAGTGTLRATNASNVASELFVGTLQPNAKWSVPTPINGHVYAEAANRIYAFAPVK